MHQEATGTGATHPFMIPLTKIDVARRLVIGTAAEEIADKSKEIMDYASARPQFEAWSEEFSKATGGLSKGNLRVMHTKHVAGRLDDIAYDDNTKKVQIVAKVVDDNDWQKCLDGVYTGFSIGGGYLKKWKDPESGLTRYTPIIREISLVDNPCVPSATFAELVKADGITEQLELRGVSRTFAQEWAARPVTFDDAWADRPVAPQTFGEMTKGAELAKSRPFAGLDAAYARLGARKAAEEAAARPAKMRQFMHEWHAGPPGSGIIPPPTKVYREPKAWPPAKRPRTPKLGKSTGLDELAKWGRPNLHESFTEAKHPRAPDGRFTGLTEGTRAYTKVENQIEKERYKKEKKRKGRGNIVTADKQGKAGAMMLGAYGASTLMDARDALRFGTGGKGERNRTAHELRGNDLLRGKMVQEARTARRGVLDEAGDAGSNEMATAAHRKIMEEAKNRGGNMSEAKAHADAFAAKVMGRTKGDLVEDTYQDRSHTPHVPHEDVSHLPPSSSHEMTVHPTANLGTRRFVSRKVMEASDRAAKHSLRGNILTSVHHFGGGMPKQGDMKNFRRNKLLSVPLIAAGGYLGQQAAFRIQHEEEGKEVSPGHHRIAAAGDALRAIGTGKNGMLLGAMAAIPLSLHLQGVSFRTAQDFGRSAMHLYQQKGQMALLAGLKHMKRGGLIGAGLGMATHLPALTREKKRRRAGNEGTP